MSSNPKACWGGRALFFGGLVLVTGCGQRQTPPLPPRPQAAPVAPAVALDPPLYVALSGSGALFAVRASGLAESRASSAALRRFASQVLRDQMAIGAQLNFAGRRTDGLPSARLQPRHRVMLDQLSSSTDFDSTYKRQIGIVLRDCVHHHRAFEASGASPTLRTVARFAAPLCEKDVEALRTL